MDLLPITINALNRPFWAAGAEGRLILPWCPATARHFWPPSPMSPYDDNAVPEWREAPGDGLLMTRAVFHRPFQQAFATLAPYAVGLVGLDAGLRLLAFAGSDEAGPRPGARVRLVFEQVVDGAPPIPTARA